ncbi:hypothetical protein M3Y99_00455300 [Aphelenchoides fujianensis]|nr:hypothetical protein M3Y99_00455300 [Aphelenchoides fujianensis]
MRAAVRDGLNRFQLVDAMETYEKKGSIRLVRLAAISRAHLVSVRRTARGIKFELKHFVWRLKMDLGIGAPAVDFAVNPKKTVGIAQLLVVPVYLAFDPMSLKNADLKVLKKLGKFVNCLDLWGWCKSLAFADFIKTVTPQLKELRCYAGFLNRFSPLDLEKLVLHQTPYDYTELNRHKIRRMDVAEHEVYRIFPSNQVLSASITSLGLRARDFSHFSLKYTETFCRRFTALQELHIIADSQNFSDDFVAQFKQLWAKCLELRDQLNISGLKRFFFKFKRSSPCWKYGRPKFKWMEQLKQVEPFDKATFTDSLDSSDTEMDTSSEDAMDDSESTDEDGMNDAGVY